MLDDLGLAAALPRFLEQWSQHHQLAAEFRTSGIVTGDLSPEAELTFYRVTQEALNNVVKHAHASRVDVILEHRDGAVVLLIEDDGVGFDPADGDLTARGIGIAGHARARRAVRRDARHRIVGRRRHDRISADRARTRRAGSRA